MKITLQIYKFVQKPKSTSKAFVAIIIHRKQKKLEKVARKG